LKEGGAVCCRGMESEVAAVGKVRGQLPLPNRRGLPSGIAVRITGSVRGLQITVARVRGLTFPRRFFDIMILGGGDGQTCGL